ncbi:MAG: alpha-amylase family glycosyl hydrolase [Verrucomicrobiota bacterium]
MRLFGSAIAAAIALGVLLAGSGASAGQAPPLPAEQEALATPGQISSLASQRIYFVMPDRYANGDPANDRGGLTGSRNATGYDPSDIGYFHGGDLKGLAERLQRIRDLGFTALWITPVVKQQTVLSGSAAYHGYWGLDFTTVDTHLGSDQDFANLVDRAHALGLKVYLDVVVNHTGDVITLSNGGTYSDIPFRDCHGTFFRAERYVTAKTFPCLAARYMPKVPYVAPGDRHLKRPAWLNDPLNYHDRGNIDFGSCSTQCFEQGDFFGLDDLFTEKPNVMKGLAQIYGSWITRFHVDGFRVDTAKHVNAAFFRLWVPRIRVAAKAATTPTDFPIFGEVTLNDAVDLSAYVAERGIPQVLDFPFQQVASAYAAGFSGAKGIARRLENDDYFRLPDGADPAFATFLGNHDMGRAAQQILSHSPGLSPSALLKHVLLGYDLLYLLRGAPVVVYGDEVGMIGSGGDKAARQDMFPTHVPEWQTETRVGSPPIGSASSFDVADNPIEAQLRSLSGLRDRYPALSTGASVVRHASGAVLVVSRIDASAGTELLAAFNNGGGDATVTVPVATPGASWTSEFGSGTVTAAGSKVTLTIPGVSAVLLKPSTAIPAVRPPAPVLVAGPDAISSYYSLRATVAGAPVTVAFAVRRSGGRWQRVAVDDSAPFRGFLDPLHYRKGTRLQAVAIARGPDGAISVSNVVTVSPRG